MSILKYQISNYKINTFWHKSQQLSHHYKIYLCTIEYLFFLAQIVQNIKTKQVHTKEFS